jgi:hypothetical protein
MCLNETFSRRDFVAQGMTDTDFSRLYERFDEIVATVGNTESSG